MFKVLQVADMHYADGRSTACEDVMPEQVAGCSDLNITAFLYRVIRAEDPALFIFTVHYSRRWAAASSRRTTTTPVQIKVSIQEKNSLCNEHPFLLEYQLFWMLNHQ
ncbi:probable inactive purple acid phosphatase 29 [Triticum dicoccoides]|uniref:probable inactive purple acid phosphatase 29 n=1 Tax=Triticum dicoccoides TaxID=85692 RepID=UPI00188FDAFC|nr:probable inactive purple acid phosphatase 29 [Triticum dicoccoides]